jgi:peptidoglycan-N-acetylglucosamine deacetylase
MGRFVPRGRGVLGAVVAVLAALVVPTGAAANRQEDPADASGPLDVARAELHQSHRILSFKVHTRGVWSPGELDRTPNAENVDARYVCLRMRRVHAVRQTQLCFGEPGVGKDSRLGYEIIEGDGSAHSLDTVKARVERIDDSTYEARFRPARAHLRPHRYRWRVHSQWSGAECPSAQPVPGEPEQAPCTDVVPDDRQAKFHLYPVRLWGCTDISPSVFFHGPRTEKQVALTFDDGPSPYTPQVLSILRDRHVKGTFFELGSQVSEAPGKARDVYRSGNELANHSLHHELYPGRTSMAETNRRIVNATGFHPCLFRPPYGLYTSPMVDAARDLGMNTVIWDVDPNDWAQPGSGTIYQRVVSNVEPGSVVLLHDGGGNRSQTVAALGPIISTLKDRGYELVTLSRLLGQRMIWKPDR